MTWGLSIFFYFLNKAGPGSPQILVRSVSTSPLSPVGGGMDGWVQRGSPSTRGRTEAYCCTND